MIPLALLTTFLLFAAVCVAQDVPPKKGLTHTPPKNVPAPTGPVTQAEARVIFGRITDSVSAVIQKPVNFRPSGLADSDEPVTREQVLLEFDRIYTAVKPYFKFTPRPVWYDPAVLSIKQVPARPILERLVREGYVARVGVLATSSSPKLGVLDFGDAVGIFVARLADVCHLPAVKFSPYLQP